MRNGAELEPVPKRNEPPSYCFLRAGQCTRCEVALGDLAIIVRERACWRILGHGDDAVALVAPLWVPVCEPCAGPDARTDRSYICGGCGIELRSHPRWRGKVCSERCEQRTRRARRRVVDFQVCVRCRKRFPGRAGAKFCSAGCKQAAYRQRAKALGVDFNQPYPRKDAA